MELSISVQTVGMPADGLIGDEGQLRLLFDATPDALVCVDADGRIVLVNAQVERVFGYRPAELVGRPVEMLVPEGRRDAHRAHRHGYVVSPHPRPMGSGLQLVARARDGTEIPVDISLSSVGLADGPVVVTAIRDVTDRVRDQAALRSAELRFNSAFRYAPIGIALIDEAGTVTVANQALAVMLAFDDHGGEGTDLVARVHGDDRDMLRGALADLVSGDFASYRCECRFVADDGRPVWVALSAVLASDVGAPASIVVLFEDITERRRWVEVLEHQAMHDPLTGLPNRVLFADRVHQALARDARSGAVTAVLYVDVDGFKNVNDIFGHEVGDAAMAELAGRLGAALRPYDTLARIGGDEFAVLAGDLAGPEEATLVAERLRVAGAAPLAVGGQQLQLSVSIGIAFARDGMDVSEMLRASDLAMYAAKKRGKDRFAIFDEALQVLASERLEMERLLQDALRHDSLVVHYQPLVYVNNRRLAGVEALVRLRKGDRLILPARFIDMAEENGLVVAMGAAVLEAACRQQALWLKQLGPAAPPRVGVNLSARQLAHSGLVRTVETALAESGLAPEHLDLEITETAFTAATGSVIKTIDQLRQLGVRLGVDDFGTGYASLTYLKRLPVDFVKIDASFVADMADNNVDETIVRSVIDLGHALGLTIIAEGVERDEELEVLQRAECDLAQGYLFSKPSPPEQLETQSH